MQSRITLCERRAYCAVENDGDEPVMVSKMTCLAEMPGLLPDTQWGICRGRSTESDLGVLTEQFHTVWGPGTPVRSLGA